MVASQLAGTLAILAVVLSEVHPQEPARPVFRSELDVVRVDVSVTDRGRPVSGLLKTDFLVTDNGVPQQVDLVDTRRIPLSLLLVLDVSRSVSGPKLTHLRNGARAVLHALDGRDRTGLIAFSQEIRVRALLSSDLLRTQASLDSVRSGGGTALRDAVQLALALSPADNTRPLVVLFTDGEDTASWVSERGLLDSVRRRGVVIHIVHVEESGAETAYLDALAEAAGGRRWSVPAITELDGVFVQVLDEMRTRYVLAYTPRGVSRGGWHTLRVKLLNGGARVRARGTYYVADEPE